MKRNYLIGLGGSGGKIISQLYARLLKERGAGFDADVECIAIDTDQDELNDLEQLGVKTVCISGSGNVGQLYNALSDDVGDWCPNTSNEGNFFSSSVFNGASQCRLKSRLCLANFLKNRNNKLQMTLEDSLTVTSQDVNVADAPPVVMIASSIAGGTGSGIFIQIALYIKKFFRDNGVQNVIIHGLFACPDLYSGVVNAQQMPKLYANAYAVIRELNAFNLICGSDTEAAYGGKVNIDVEISTACEGKLFEKDSAGRYGDKPYDLMYFIDKVNFLSRILGGLPEYYKAMANIAYSHLYTDISGEVSSNENNEMDMHSKFPNAIYGSAGAATLKYPFDDIIRYFANRSIKESFDGVWSELDRQWKNYYAEKDATARSAGQSRYVPDPDERTNHYINSFKKLVKSTSIAKSQFTFLSAMIERDGAPAEDRLFAKIAQEAVAAIGSDDRMIEEKKLRKLANLEKVREGLLSKVENATGDNKTDSGLFKQIKDIDDNLEMYCRNCITYIDDMSITFANEIFCDDKTLWDSYDSKDHSVIKGLLKKDGAWIHPVAARYLLYSFITKLDKKINSLLNNFNTPQDDIDDYFNKLMTQYVVPHKSALAANDESKGIPNAKILHANMEKTFGKKATKKGVNSYFTKLNENLVGIEKVFAEALQYFAFIKIRGRIANLIDEYEQFFDNIDEFIKKATVATNSAENMHDNSRGVIYVCASAEVKQKMYEVAGRNIDTQTGETASLISKGLFDSLRVKAAAAGNTSKKKMSHKEKVASMESFFSDVSDIVTASSKNNPEIQGSVDKNVFDAILYEYALMNPEYADDETRYQDSDAKNRIDNFITGKLSALSKMAAPMLSYDAKDPYYGIFETEDTDDRDKVCDVSTSYRYISHNNDVDKSIRKLLGTSDDDVGAVSDFYSKQSAELPKDSEGQTISIGYECSEDVDPYSVLCYSTVHCLQPYQIKAFNELGGGAYYEEYSKKIVEMESKQRYSMTPHLDKRWHKHGVMPYINVAKELDRRFDLGLAFIYALCFGKIGYYDDGFDTKYVYQDLKLGKEAEIIFYKGRSIPYNKINRAMYWFADQDSLIERYSNQLEALINDEVEMLSRYADTVGKYKTNITNQARRLNQLKRKIIRPIEVLGSGNGRAKKLREKPSMSILEFAWKLHMAEENEFDKDYGELLVEMLCDIIKRYAKGPYNAEDIKNKVQGSSAYATYIDVRDHIKEAFLEEYAVAIGKKMKEEIIIEDDDDLEQPIEKRNAFGRSDEDVTDDYAVEVKTESGNVKSAVANSGELLWATALMNKYLAD